MLAKTLSDLRCPKCKQGLLHLDESHLPVITKDLTNEQEIHEALLRCSTCETLYPVVAGVAIIVQNPFTYVAQNFSIIQKFASNWISSAMFNYWNKYLGKFPNAKQPDTYYDSEDTLQTYIFSHYENINKILPSTHPLQKILGKNCGNWYQGLLNIAEPYLLPQQKALDIGCNVGGLVYRLGFISNFVYGLDYSFGTVFHARQILLGLPYPQNTYHLHLEGITYQERLLSLEKLENVEIVIASSESIPFNLESFDLVTVINLIDVIPNPVKFLDSVYSLLKNQGIFLTTDPYYWGLRPCEIEERIGGYVNLSSSEAMRTEVSKRFKLLDEEDTIPWLLRVYERHYKIYFNHHIVAQKLVS